MPITCRICNQTFKKFITNTHLKRHNIRLTEYKNAYGSDSICCPVYRTNQSLKNSGKNNPNYNNKWSTYQKKKLSDVLKGREAHNIGKKMSENQKEKLHNAGIKRYKEWNKIGYNPIKHRIFTNKIKKQIGNSIKNYANRNPEKLSERAHKALETRKNNGYNIAFFEGKKHTNESKEKIKESVKKRGKLTKNITNNNYNDKIYYNNLSLLNNITEHFLKLECNRCHRVFYRTRQSFQDSKNRKNKICPTCYPMKKGPSTAELEILNYIKKIFPHLPILANDRIILNGLELDIVIPTLKIAIEYCGLYWHSELMGKDKTYHKNKMDICINKGYQLITIFEDEWENNKLLVKQKIKKLLRYKLKSIFAINCQVRIISNNKAISFLKKYSLQEYNKNSINLGLYYKKNLVAVMSFNNIIITQNQNNEWKLNSYNTINNFIIIDGANKLFNYFIKCYNPNSIITYSDRRWYIEKIYHHLGFTLISEISQKYWYVEGIKRGCRESLMQNKKIQKLNRIWDCGYLKFKWIKKSNF